MERMFTCRMLKPSPLPVLQGSFTPDSLWYIVMLCATTRHNAEFHTILQCQCSERKHDLITWYWATGQSAGGSLSQCRLLVAISKVTLHPARLVLRWVTVFVQANHLSMQPSTVQAQLSLAIPLWVGTMSTGIDVGHCGGISSEFCVAVDPVTRTYWSRWLKALAVNWPGNISHISGLIGLLNWCQSVPNIVRAERFKVPLLSFLSPLVASPSPPAEVSWSTVGLERIRRQRYFQYLLSISEL